MSSTYASRLTGLLASALILCFSTTSGASYHVQTIAFMASTVGQVSADEQSHLWLEQVGNGDTGVARLVLSFDAYVALAEPQVLECRIESEKDLGSNELRFELLDSAGMLLQTGGGTFAGQALVTFDWDPTLLVDGEFKILCTLRSIAGERLAWSDIHVTKLAEGTVETIMAAANEMLVVLDERLIQLESDLPYPRMRLAVAKDFLELARSNPDDLGRNYHIAEYAASTAKSIRGGLALDALIPHDSAAAPFRSVSNLSLRNAGFYAAQEPVFLMGMKGLRSPESDLPRLARYGLNLAVVEQGSLDEGAHDTQSLDDLFASAKSNNVSVTYVLSPFERVATELEDFDSGLTSYLSSQEMLNSVSVAFAPTFSLRGEEVEAEFIKHVRSIYEDRYTLNRAWRTRLVDFSEIEIWTDNGRASYQYDWQTYQRGLVSQHYSGLVQETNAAHPNLRLQAMFGDDILEFGESKNGIAREPLAKLFDLSGIAGSSSLTEAVFAMRYPDHAMNYALLHSFAPDKPIFAIYDLYLDTGAQHRRDVYGDMRSLVWESAMEGVNALALGVWDPKSAPHISYLSIPEGLEGFASASIDLNRLGRIVKAFQDAPAPVAILWSDSAKMYDDGVQYLASARRAYEGVSFGGFKIRFVTETQLAEGDTKGIEVLVVPDTPAITDSAFAALQELVDTGLAVIRSAAPIPYDSWGHSRKGVITYGLNTWLVRGRDTSTEFLHALDAVVSDGGVAPAPRAINRYGYPLEGVKTRSIEYEGERYIYLINLRKDTVLCHLFGDYTSGYDLIAQREMRFPNLVKPLQPLLIRLNPIENEETLAKESDEHAAQGATRLQVRPVHPLSD